MLQIGVMGGEQAAGVLAQVEAEKRKRSGGGWSPDEEAALRQRIAAVYDAQATPEFASARLWCVDGREKGGRRSERNTSVAWRVWGAGL